MSLCLVWLVYFVLQYFILVTLAEVYIQATASTLSDSLCNIEALFSVLEVSYSPRLHESNESLLIPWNHELRQLTVCFISSITLTEGYFDTVSNDATDIVFLTKSIPRRYIPSLHPMAPRLFSAHTIMGYSFYGEGEDLSKLLRVPRKMVILQTRLMT